MFKSWRTTVSQDKKVLVLPGKVAPSLKKREWQHLTPVHIQNQKHETETFYRVWSFGVSFKVILSERHKAGFPPELHC